MEYEIKVILLSNFNTHHFTLDWYCKKINKKYLFVVIKMDKNCSHQPICISKLSKNASESYLYENEN